MLTLTAELEFFLIFFFAHLRWESGLWFISHNLSKSDSLKKKRREKKRKNQTVLMRFHQKRTSWRREHSANETAPFNSFFTIFHTQIKSGLSPQLNFKWHSKYPQKLLARDKPPYQKRQHETNAIRKSNKCHTMSPPPPHPHGTVIARLESNRLLRWIINFPNSLELSKCWSVRALLGTLY